MRNLCASLLILVGLFMSFCKASAIGGIPNRLNSKSKRLETFSSRYTMPNNDPSLISKLPFTFGYRFTDDYGTMQTREEKTDPNGSKTGSYSFVDSAGTYRHVDYIADRHGFRATVKTNEPGTIPADPADVRIHIDNDRNVHSPLQKTIRSSPEMEYSSHIFSRYNHSSNYGQQQDHLVLPLQNNQQSLFYDDDKFEGNIPKVSIPHSDPPFGKDGNLYKSSQYPVRQPLQSVFIGDLSNPIGYPKTHGLNPEEFFNDPNLNPGYVFGDKIADSGYNNKPAYSLLPPSTPTRYPRRQRLHRARPKQSRQQYKIHTPRGFENYPDLPLYMDK